MTHIGQQSQYNSKLANHPKPAIALTAVTYLLLGFLETLPGTIIPSLLYFFALGVLALCLMPSILGLPNGRKSLRDYCQDIRLLPMRPLGRNILLGLLMAALTLSSIFLAALLTGHFVFDWSTVPALRWVKGLTRGIWEEVFFRGIILVLFMRVFLYGIALHRCHTQNRFSSAGYRFSLYTRHFCAVGAKHARSG
jgi:hypothetical protein